MWHHSGHAWWTPPTGSLASERVMSSYRCLSVQNGIIRLYILYLIDFTTLLINEQNSISCVQVIQCWRHTLMLRWRSSTRRCRCLTVRCTASLCLRVYHSMPRCWQSPQGVPPHPALSTPSLTATTRDSLEWTSVSVRDHVVFVYVIVTGIFSQLMRHELRKIVAHFCLLVFKS